MSNLYKYPFCFFPFANNPAARDSRLSILDQLLEYYGARSEAWHKFANEQTKFMETEDDEQENLEWILDFAIMYNAGGEL